MADTASFIAVDTATQGTWVGVYGADGWSVRSDATSNPSYCTPVVTGGSDFSFGSPSAPISMQQGSNAGATRIRAVYFGGNLKISLSITGSAKVFRVYFADYDASGRAANLTFKTSGGSTLDTRTVSSFSAGKWYSWLVSGNVDLFIDLSAGANMVFSGWAFDADPNSTDKQFNETLALTEALSVQLLTGLSLTPLSDTLALSDAGTVSLGDPPKFRGYQTYLKVLYQPAGTGSESLELSDTLVLSDSLTLALFAVLSVTGADTLDFSDAGQVALGLQASLSDTLTFTDALATFKTDSLYVSGSDTLALLDDSQVNFLIYAYPIFLEFSERLELEDAAWDIPFNSEPGFTQQHGETLHFQETITGPLEELFASAADTLSLTEAGEIILRAAVEGYDTLFYNWAEELKLELQQVLRFEETLSFSDALAMAVVITGINVTGSDSLASLWADAVATRTESNPSFAETLSFYEALEIKIFGGLQLADALELSDALALQMSGSNPSQGATGFSDTLQLAEQLTIVLSVPLRLQLSDALTLSDNLNAQRKGTDLSYLRRYLNDVKRD